MMKLTIKNTKNTDNGSVQFPVSEPVREDLIRRAVHSLQANRRQPYGADPRAGLKHSTRISRRRRDFRGSYGIGISRVPRKVMMRRGTQHYWSGAEAPGTVGGRRAHPPKAEKQWGRKLNRKENRKAIDSAMSASLTKDLVQKRGHIVPDSYPFALDADFSKIKKTKELIAALSKLGFSDDLARGRNGAKTVLLVTESEDMVLAARNIPGVDIASASELNAELLAPGAHPGRAALFTVESIEALTKGPVDKPAKKPAAKQPKKAKKSAKKKTAKKKDKKSASKKKTTKKKASKNKSAKKSSKKSTKKASGEAEK